jgi:Bacterial DNA-binding protein
MIKSQLVLRVAEQKSHLYNRDVEKAVNAIFGEIEAPLVRRDRVELRGFGPGRLGWGVIPRPGPKSVSQRPIILRSG